MKTFTIILSLGFIAALSSVIAADKSSAGSADAAFIRKAANGGMAEVELGKVAEKNGDKQDVKDFGSRMVKDHGKANDDLKAIAEKMNVKVPDKVNAKHQAAIDKLSKESGATFDADYKKDMVKDHEKDIAEFEKARGEVGSEDLKKFIDQTVPVMKEHLEMAKKLGTSK